MRDPRQQSYQCRAPASLDALLSAETSRSCHLWRVLHYTAAAACAGASAGRLLGVFGRARRAGRPPGCPWGDQQCPSSRSSCQLPRPPRAQTSLLSFRIFAPPPRPDESANHPSPARAAVILGIQLPPISMATLPLYTTTAGQNTLLDQIRQQVLLYAVRALRAARAQLLILLSIARLPRQAANLMPFSATPRAERPEPAGLDRRQRGEQRKPSYRPLAAPLTMSVRATAPRV